MVSSTNYAMVSALAGLRRLEAQIQRAMLDAGGQAARPEAPAEKRPDELKVDADKAMQRANSVLNNLDLFA